MLNGSYFGFISGRVMQERYNQEERKKEGELIHVAHPYGNTAREMQYRKLAQKLHGRPRGKG